MNGKGDRPRPYDKARYERNYLRIFGNNLRISCGDSGDIRTKQVPVYRRATVADLDLSIGLSALPNEQLKQ